MDDGKIIADVPQYILGLVNHCFRSLVKTSQKIQKK